jgi:PIN domain nuclease of toxin-antitoxin system
VVVLDTHAWIWWTDDPSRLSPRAFETITGSESIGVPTMACWEVALLVEKDRLRLEGGARSWIRAALGQPGIVALPVSPKIALEAAQLDFATFPGDPADRLIYATARDAGASLVTRDAHIREFDPRGTIW